MLVSLINALFTNAPAASLSPEADTEEGPPGPPRISRHHVSSLPGVSSGPGTAQCSVFTELRTKITMRHRPGQKHEPEI